MNKKYSNNEIKTLKQNIRLESLIKEDFVLKKIGKNFFTKCPFCKKEQSLCVSLEKQFAYCFSCQESFDCISYFQKIKGVSFHQAIIEIKKHINIQNDIELKKLLQASIHFSELKQGKNPITGNVLNDNIFFEEKTMIFFQKMDWVLKFLVGDYCKLDQEKYLLTEEIIECQQMTNRILQHGFNNEEKESKEKLSNLFNYIFDLLVLIEKNNNNLSGIVYGLKK